MPQDSFIGTRLGRYLIRERIGQGGMSRVYRAEHELLGTQLAVKVLSAELSEDPQFRDRFLDEARLAARLSLQHPNIARIYDANEERDTLYIAMDYISEGDLRRLIEQAPLSAERVLNILAQVADALDFAHRHGLVHRDVKPANVLVASGDRAFLTDFGIAKDLSERIGLTRTGTFLGTIDYAAPEQISGQEVDGRADVYALGCVLFECLTGSPPFARELEVQTIHAHLYDPPPKLTERRRDVPRELDAVVACALAKTKEARYATCNALVQAAQAAVETGGAGRAPRVAPGGAPTRAARTEAPVEEAPFRIFINYRRSDSAGYAGRLWDALATHFGADRVFIDIDTIRPGVDFSEVIHEAVNTTDVVVAVIGKGWLTAEDARGKRRLEDPDDFVRMELAAALERNVRLIPALVGGTEMPAPDQLPDELRRLARRNALELSDARWRYDVERLIRTLEEIERERTEKTRLEREQQARASAELAEREREERERIEREEREARERAEAERAEAERIAGERAAAAEAARIERERQEREASKRAEAERVAAERAAAERAAAERAAAERTAAERAAAERAAAERAAAERAEAERVREETILATRAQAEPDAVAPAAPAPAAAEEREERRRGRPLVLILIVGGVAVAAAAGGFLAGHSGGTKTAAPTVRPPPAPPPPPSSATIAAGKLRLRYPASWRRLAGNPTVPGIDFRTPVNLAPAGHELAAGLGAGSVSAAPPTLLPKPFLALDPAAGTTREIVRLGRVQAFRYRGLRPAGFGKQLTLYVVPTTPVTMVACFARPDLAPRLLRVCEGIATTLVLSGPKPYPLAPSRPYARALSAAASNLKNRRGAGVRALAAAKTQPAQAHAAAVIARAYATAARRVARAPVNPLVADPNRAIAAALRGTAGAYGALERAARAGSRVRYDQARQLISVAERGVRRAVLRLTRLGYAVG